MTLQDVIDFLLDLLRNEDTQAEFERDPEGVLADRGLAGVTAQDVRDARLVLADRGGARAVGDDPPPGGDDPIREIRFTEDNFAAGPEGPPQPPAPDIIEQSTSIVAIDDRDTFVVQNTTTSDDDITVIQDSFNDSSTTDVVAIQANRTIVEGEPEPGVNPPPAAVVTEPGVEIPAPEGNEPAPIETAPIETEPADDAPADIGVVDDTDDTAAEAAEPEPAEEGDPDPTLDTAVI
jgi:hypothetical protein